MRVMVGGPLQSGYRVPRGRGHAVEVRCTVALALALTLLPACDTPRSTTAVEVAEAPDVAALRAGGRAALQRLRAEGAPDELLDAVAQQRDGAASGLFWETDMEHALTQARERGVPVLSLRMLGALTDERSCANSRFFRTLLYTDAELAKFLDEAFVLHWSTERPVPQVEIDFGDGRVLHTTTTGNSAHYVLDANGKVLDVLPGLYDARTFQARLEEVSRLHAALAEMPQRQDVLLQAYHRDAARAVEERLAALMGPDLRAWMNRPPGSADDPPVTALAAQPITVMKSRVEAPLLSRIDPERRGLKREAIEASLRSLAVPVTFSAAAQALVRRDRPQRSGENDERYEARIAALLESAGESVAYDTLINEARLHYQVHGWFAAGEATQNFEALNARVYMELFATPKSDRWLGLADETTYDGLSEGDRAARGSFEPMREIAQDATG